MASVDAVLAPRATPDGVKQAEALREKLQGQLQQLDRQLACLDRLMLQRARLQQQQQQREEASSADGDLTQFLPDITVHLEEQQAQLMQLVGSVKKAQRDLGILERHFGHSRGLTQLTSQVD